MESLDCIRLEGIWHLKIIFYKYTKCMSALKISFCDPGHEGWKLYLPSKKCYFSNFLRIQEGCAELMWGLLNCVLLASIFVHCVGFETDVIFSEEMTERETDRIGKNQTVLTATTERKLWRVVISHIQNAYKKKSRLAKWIFVGITFIRFYYILFKKQAHLFLILLNNKRKETWSWEFVR